MSLKRFEMVYSSNEGFSLVELPERKELSGSEVLIKPQWVGVCGSDLHVLDFYKGDNLRLGHEWVGVVEEVGKDVSQYKIGDHVTSTPFINCGKCKFCLEGKTNFCETPIILGSDFLGAIRSEIIIDQHCIIPVPNNLDSSAALIEVFSVGENAADQIEPFLIKDQPTLILGGGAIGQVCALSMKERGYDVVIIEMFSERVKRCKELGLNTIPLAMALMDPSLKQSFVQIIDCSGDNGEGKGGWKYLTHFGAKGFFALMLAKYSEDVLIQPNSFGDRNATLKWLRGTPQSAIEKASNVWSSRLKELEKIMVSHIIPVSNVSEAFELAKDKKSSGKVIIKIDS